MFDFPAYYSRRKEKGLCRGCGKIKEDVTKSYCVSCRTSQSAWHKQRHDELKEAVYNHYGNRCACCGEAQRGFLSIDHIDGWRKTHSGDSRRKGSEALYSWIIRSDFPDSIRLLCMNCNFAFGKWGFCPHTTE